MNQINTVRHLPLLAFSVLILHSRYLLEWYSSNLWDFCYIFNSLGSILKKFRVNFLLLYFAFLLYSKFIFMLESFRYFYMLFPIIYLVENVYLWNLVLVFLRLWKWSFFWNILPIVLENNLVLLCYFSLLIEVVNRILRWMEFYQGVNSPPKYSFCIFLYNVIFMFMLC